MEAIQTIVTARKSEYTVGTFPYEGAGFNVTEIRIDGPDIEGHTCTVLFDNGSSCLVLDVVEIWRTA
jgi:hypothetical protein